MVRTLQIPETPHRVGVAVLLGGQVLFGAHDSAGGHTTFFELGGVVLVNNTLWTGQTPTHATLRALFE